MKSDGSVITQLLDNSITDQLVDGASWSADSKSIILDLGNNQTGKSDLYLIDIQKAESDPSIKPVRLSTDNAWKYGATWQPQQ